jgi:hypothetical protein
MPIFFRKRRRTVHHLIREEKGPKWTKVQSPEQAPQNTHSHTTSFPNRLGPVKVTRDLNAETLKMFGSSRNPTPHLIKKDASDRA